jgi:hypothetical protein
MDLHMWPILELCAVLRRPPKVDNLYVVISLIGEECGISQSYLSALCTNLVQPAPESFR